MYFKVYFSNMQAFLSNRLQFFKREQRNDIQILAITYTKETQLNVDLFIPQSLNWVQIRRLSRRIKAKKDAHGCGETKGEKH